MFNKSFLWNKAGYDEYTKLMLHMDGTNESTTFTDEIGHTITANGNTKISTAQAKFGQSVFFDGDGDYLSVPDSTDWDFAGDFTIDFWVRFTTYNSYQNIISTTSDGNANDGFWIELGSGRGFTLYNNGSLVFASTNVALTGMSTDTWYHIAVVRNGTSTNNMAIYLNGVNKGQATSTVSINGGFNPLLIGKYSTTSTVHYLAGYLDELRISKGIARWTSDFTPPTSPY